MSPQKGYRILIVDDLFDNLLLLQTLLEAEGYAVTTADGGISALAQIEAHPPDLVLLDIMMPDLNGYEVTRRIRQNSTLPFFPILLISAHEQESATQGLSLGADSLICKPIDFDRLLTVIGNALPPKPGCEPSRIRSA